MTDTNAPADTSTALAALAASTPPEPPAPVAAAPAEAIGTPADTTPAAAPVTEGTPPDPVVTVVPALTDLALNVESAMVAHMKATEKANASAIQAQKDKDDQSTAHIALHAAVSALIDAAKADDPA